MSGVRVYTQPDTAVRAGWRWIRANSRRVWKRK